MNVTAEKRTRYPGLTSFTTEQRDLFFGRKQETRDLFNLISVERTVVLFSKSGYGKTSLLQAGVMPLLSEKQIVAVPIRFGTDALTPESHFSLQMDAAWHRFNGKTSEEAQKAAKDTSREESFWEQIARCRFEKAGEPFEPLFIFDQFEELFTLYPDPDRRNAFVEQLADLVNERTPDALRKKIVAGLRSGAIQNAEAVRLEKAPPMRFVFSIRSDMLHFMDELSEPIPYILRSRYQLFGLNEAQAKEAIAAPAALAGEGFASQPFGYKPEALDEIVGSLSKNQEVESFQLQAVCQAIEEKIMRGQRPSELAGKQKFDPMHLRPVGRDGLRSIDTDFYGGREGIDNIIEENYNKRLDSLGDLDEAWPEQARHILEDVLVNKNDRRQSVDVVELAAPAALLDELERQRLVRKEPRLDSFYFEISHDTWLPAIVKSRKVRQGIKEKERLDLERKINQQQKRKATILFIGGVVLVLISFIASVYAYAKKKEGDELYLASTYLGTKRLPPNLGEFPIDSLDFSGWGLKTVPKEIGKMKTLQVLRLSGHGLALLPDEIGQLVNLKTLDICSNRLVVVPMTMGNLTLLEELCLKNNSLIVFPKEIKPLLALKSLNLQRNRLVSIPTEIGLYKRLETLHLNDNRISFLSHTIGQLINLKYLNLAGNKLTTLPSEFRKLNKLESLDLAGNRLNDMPIEILTLNNLRYLDIRGNLFSDTFIQKLILNLPKCTVVYKNEHQEWNYSLHNSDRIEELSLEIAIYKQENDINGAIEALLELCDAQLNQNDYKKAVISAEDALNLGGTVKAKIALANAYFFNNQWERAKPIYSELKKIPFNKIEEFLEYDDVSPFGKSSGALLFYSLLNYYPFEKPPHFDDVVIELLGRPMTKQELMYFQE